jgi:hypothetical protein
MFIANNNGAQLEQIANKYWNDFIETFTNPWSAVAVNSGTIYDVFGEQKHSGIIEYRSSVSANSGFRFSTNINSILINGCEKTTAILKMPTSLSTLTTRIGFHDATTNADASNGVYLEIVSGVIVGKTALSNTRSITASSFTLSPNTWYRFVVEVDKAKSLVYYKLFADDSDEILWQDTISSNIPTGATGHGVISTSSGTTAITVLVIDYLDIVIPNRRIT